MLQLEAKQSHRKPHPSSIGRSSDFAKVDAVRAALLRAGQRLAPVWPLESFVAVNPYLGMTDMTFGEVAGRLAKVAGARTTMPIAYYLDLLAQRRITESDVAAALDDCDDSRAEDVEGFLRQVGSTPSIAAPIELVPTVADEARELTGKDWERLATERIANWAAAYFDEGYALWPSATRAETIFASWKAEASIDRTPELMGLKGFRQVVKSLPDDPLEAARLALEELGVPRAAWELYLHRLLLRVGGWAAFAARTAWERNRDGQADDSLIEFQAVLLSWELALHRTLKDADWPSRWANACRRLAATAECADEEAADWDAVILQTAFDRAEQRRTIANLAGSNDRETKAARPRVQAVFCIDVRSEVFRRHFESTADGIETLGFAGFFAFPLAYVPIGHVKARAQCPVLLTPRHTILESLPDEQDHQRAVARRTLKRHVGRAWYSFKMGAISCFSFVGPVGLGYLPKLFTDAFGLTRPVPTADSAGLAASFIEAKGPRLQHQQHGHAASGLTLAERVELAAGALRAMSLTGGFAPLVMIVGHGSTTVNNPHAAGLDCGACGGNSGEANARVAAGVLNDPAVREALRARGIDVPQDTIFLACLHDTTTDELTIFNRADVPSTHAEQLLELEQWLEQAGRGARAERALRFSLTASDQVDEAVLARSRDWSQVRPEWGLAGCRAFIVAPRSRTAEVDLGGRAFLHSYDWRQDHDFSTLELIMTAPMVVASWINLQYYGSTVENRLFGAGNKTLHNVVGKIGVLEGNTGDLRVGLPWQSVHDGRQLQHEPLRLSVVIEAPREAVQQIIERHASVRDLVTNGWVHLTVVDTDRWYRWTSAGHWEETAADSQ
ncbi:MAG: DUF2309 domain-containing protein [Planctomycetales bacterium]|nr:DUF2309 domain-containing protein [Planctomycetales bacterium]